MSGYSELTYYGVTFRPLHGIGHFRRLVTRRRSPFRASWSSTVELLAKELRALNARRVVIELDMDEADFRLDGIPRANATARTPGVVISFESPHGPLRYAVDTFDHWQDNIRAVALGLQALRAVDRYGVTKRGEQYAGWKALPTGSGPSADRGRALIRAHGSVKRALFATHPDHGGSADDFADVQAARELATA